MRNLSSLPRVTLAISCVLIFAVQACAQSSDQQSLGDAAKAQHKQKSNAKVIDDDEMARRGIHHDAGAATFDCDADCVADVKRETIYSKLFAGKTDEQWQTVFAAAKDELAQGDWSQRLAAIQQEFCRTPGKVDFKKVKQMDIDMATKEFYESSDKHIDTMAALAHPNDASGLNALAQMRVEGMKGAILKVRREHIMTVCYVPGTQDTSAAH